MRNLQGQLVAASVGKAKALCHMLENMALRWRASLKTMRLPHMSCLAPPISIRYPIKPHDSVFPSTFDHAAAVQLLAVAQGRCQELPRATDLHVAENRFGLSTNFTRLSFTIPWFILTSVASRETVQSSLSVAPLWRFIISKFRWLSLLERRPSEAYADESKLRMASSCVKKDTYLCCWRLGIFNWSGWFTILVSRHSFSQGILSAGFVQLRA